MNDILLIKEMIIEFKQLGVSHIVACAGARNALWIKLISQNESFTVWSFPEERSAAFFALGLTKQSESPVLVITTSGTAVVECFPAVVEAHYQKLPLWIVSADRPKSYRGSGAPQSIEQSYIFGNYATCWDWDAIDWMNLNPPVNIPEGPIQFNICLEDPKSLMAKVDEFVPLKPTHKLKLMPLSINEVKSLSKKLVENPILIVAPLVYQKHRNWVTNWLKQQKIYFYLEGASGVFDTQLLKSPYRLSNLEDLLTHLEDNTHFKWNLIKLGNTPLFSSWRSIEHFKTVQQIYCFNEFNYSGLPQSASVLKSTLLQIEDYSLISQPEFENYLFQYKIKNISPRAINSEEILFAKIKKSGSGHRFYIGNSLPIRHWDKFEPMTNVYDFWSYRGVNGIDGQLSGFLGWCSFYNTGVISHAIIGDLTAFYDLQSLWVAKQIKTHFPKISLVIWIINNQGGRIFDRLFKDDLYQNTHALKFEYWAKMYEIPFKKIRTEHEIESVFQQIAEGLQIVEVQAYP